MQSISIDTFSALQEISNDLIALHSAKRRRALDEHNTNNSTQATKRTNKGAQAKNLIPVSELDAARDAFNATLARKDQEYRKIVERERTALQSEWQNALQSRLHEAEQQSAEQCSHLKELATYWEHQCRYSAQRLSAAQDEFSRVAQRSEEQQLVITQLEEDLASQQRQLEETRRRQLAVSDIQQRKRTTVAPAAASQRSASSPPAASSSSSPSPSSRFQPHFTARFLDRELQRQQHDHPRESSSQQRIKDGDNGEQTQRKEVSVKVTPQQQNHHPHLLLQQQPAEERAAAVRYLAEQLLKVI